MVNQGVHGVDLSQRWAPGPGARNPLDIGIRGHEAAWRDVITVIWSNSRPLAVVRGGYKVTALMDATYRAAQTGRAVLLA